MSEPLSSHDNEDVLSSIRRLVSEELTPQINKTVAAAQADSALDGAEDGAEAGPEKLLLTPSLRVVQNTAAAPEPASVPAVTTASLAPQSAAVTAQASDEGAELGALRAADSAPAPDVFLLLPEAQTKPESNPQPAAQPNLSTPAVAKTERAGAFDPSSVDAGVFFGAAAPLGAKGGRGGYDDNGAYDDAGLDQGGDGLQVVIDSLPGAEHEAPTRPGDLPFALADSTDLPLVLSPTPVEDLPAKSQLPEIDWMQAEEDWVEPEPVLFTARPRAALSAAAATPDPLAEAWAARAEAEVRAELEAPAAFVHRNSYESSTAPAGAAPAERVSAEEPVGQAATDAEAAPEAAGSQASGLLQDQHEADDAFLDEDQLREIVRAMIREELAGSLGERITRNVRKLVRLEVNRALTARDFE